MAKRAWRYWEPMFAADTVCELNPVWPWGGHRRFAYDLVRWMRPARIAELGVHWGTSFFAFAQAVKDGRMKDTELVGVDTFEGEEHAGQYGPEVLDTVRGIVKKHFPTQKITLHKMLFSEALSKVDDGSIDLLHIDGLHTYDAVKEDFETWLPKLAPDGIVLFHDVAPDTGYGSTDYWNELVGRHPGFAFEHSWGLGVLFPKGDARLAELKELGLDDKILVYASRARADRADHEVRDLSRMAEERAEAMRKQGEMVRQRDETIEKLRAALADAQGLAKTGEAQERQRREAVRRLTGQIERAKQVAAERLATVRELRAKLHEAERSAAAATSAGEQLRARVEDLRERIRVQDERLTEGREHRKEMQGRLDEARERMASLRETAAAQREAAAAQRQALDRAAKAQAALENRLQAMAEHVVSLVNATERTRTQSEEKLSSLIKSLDDARRAAEAAGAALAERVLRLGHDTELLSVRAEYLEDLVAEHRERLSDLGGEESEPDWLTGAPAGARPAKKRSMKR